MKRLPVLLVLLAVSPAGAAEPEGSGFSFGSYGRVVAATDGTGRTPADADIVSHGSRLDEGNYWELDFYYRFAALGAARPVRTRLVSTLAVRGEPFHYTGDWSAEMALRNLYVEARGIGSDALVLWAGERTYRGDDIYLFDYWPLDNLNTLGAGASYAVGDVTAALHAGVNRLRNPYQLQIIDVPAPPTAYGAAQVAYLDRQRFVATARADWTLGCRGAFCLRARLWGEAHAIGAGDAIDVANPNVTQRWPADGGWAVGGEVSAWRRESADFLNVWVREAGGLAAYGDLGAPYGFAPDRTVGAARELVVAASGNFERGAFALLWGAYARRFVDADPNVYDNDDRWEGIAAVRPHVFFTEHTGLAAEASVQAVQTAGLDPTTLRNEVATVSRVALIPFVSPLGRGVFRRPQIRAIVSAAFPNAAAQRMRPDLDPLRNRSVIWFLGVSAEWWFDSTYR